MFEWIEVILDMHRRSLLEGTSTKEGIERALWGRTGIRRFGLR